MVGAFVDGNILQVLFFSILFGIALAMVGDAGAPVLDVLNALSQVVFKLVGDPDEGRPDRRVRRLRLHHRHATASASIANLAALVATFYVTSLVFVIGGAGRGRLRSTASRSSA